MPTDILLEGVSEGIPYFLWVGGKMPSRRMLSVFLHSWLSGESAQALISRACTFSKDNSSPLSTSRCKESFSAAGFPGTAAVSPVFNF